MFRDKFLHSSLFYRPHKGYEPYESYYMSQNTMSHMKNQNGFSTASRIGHLPNYSNPFRLQLLELYLERSFSNVIDSGIQINILILAISISIWKISEQYIGNILLTSKSSIWKLKTSIFR